MVCNSLHQTDLHQSSARPSETRGERRVSIIGAGPAGSSAAVTALLSGTPVDLFEQSRFPRHKVCGEFLSPAAADLLDTLGAWSECTRRGAIQITRGSLHFRRFEKRLRLPEIAYGLTRFALDEILYRRAVELAATFRQQRARDARPPLVLATGRAPATALRDTTPRLFGFKAHFNGPQHDAIELFFAPGIYVGLNAVELGRTNVCGLAREDALKRFGFEFDAVCDGMPGLRTRLDPLRRETQWYATGPVRFGFQDAGGPGDHSYLAGDRLSFVDPFTGTGITNALYSGILAGRAAATGIASSEYEAKCRAAFGGAYQLARLFRIALEWTGVDLLAPFLPGALLFRLTRPAIRRHGGFQKRKTGEHSEEDTHRFGFPPPEGCEARSSRDSL